MADEITLNLGLTKPEVGGSDDTWGEKTNHNWDLVDAAIADALSIPPEYVTDAELTVILDGYISDAEINAILADYVTDAELAAALAAYVTTAAFPEMVDDRVAALLQAGANITLTYNDAGNQLTIASTASGGGGGDVVGPAGAVADDIAVFNGATGKLIKDGGKKISDLALVTQLTAPATTVPLVESGSGAVGVSAKYAREDHVHPLGPGGGGGTSVVIADTAPVGQPAGTLWWESDSGLLYVNYNDGTSTQWVVAAPSAVASRSSIYAAPMDALAYNGMQINGSMEVSQELGTTGRVTAGYVLDGWIHAVQGTATSGVQQIASASFPGYSYVLQGNIGTAQPSLGSGDYLLIYQPIEGYRIARLGWGTANAQPITIGFWSSHTPAGIYSVVVANAPTTHSYSAPYTQAVAGVPQFNIITIPGPTVGTWKKDNTAGAYLYFTRAVGSSLIASTANTWLSGSYLGAPGQVNAAVTGSFFTFTGVVVLPGIEAPSAARSSLIMRPYDQELVTCKRQYRQIIPEGGGLANGVAQAFFTVSHNGMRAAPIVDLTAVAVITNVSTTTFTQSAINVAIFSTNDTDRGTYSFSNFTGLTNLQPLVFHPNSGKLKLDARL